MAFVSFALRRYVIDRGSYARYDTDTYNTAASAGNAASAGTWIYDHTDDARDIDQYLRSDGYQIPPNEFVTSFIEASAVSYGTVNLNWELPLTSEIGETTVPTEGVLVYSSSGPAATVASGSVLVESSNVFSYEHTGLRQGKWAYYTLFVRYQSSLGVDFYEPVASVEVLVPYNYQSTLLLWERIPEYYRDLDTQIGEYIDPASDYAVKELGCLPVGGLVGPLFKFLSIFGFEMDRIRTTVDYLMISRDPAEANTEVLDALASTLGLAVNSSSISVERLRALLDDLGYIRRAKGTLEGARLYGRAVSGSNIDVDSAAREIKIYAQRVNYITDPLDATGVVSSRPAHEVEVVAPLYSRGTYDPTTYVEGDSNTYPTKLSIEEYVPGMYWTSASATTFKSIPVGVGDYIVAYRKNDSIDFAVHGNSFSATNYSSYTTYSTSGTEYVPNGSGASVGVNHLLLQFSDPVPVLAGDTVSVSVHSAVGTSALVWGRLVDESGNVIGQSVGTTKANDAPAVEIPALDNVSAEDWTIGFVELLINLEAVSAYDLSYILIERNRLGNYFDGSDKRGGWISNPSGTSRTSDYNWSNEGSNTGTAYESISVYSEDFQRTRSIIGYFFTQILPITQYQYYTITSYNAIPGMDAIDAYLTGP